MHRIPPSAKVRQRINAVLQQGLDTPEDLSQVVFRLGVERLVQEMLEQEVTDYLGREPYQRRKPHQEARGYRNGYEVGRIRTSEGEVSVQVPQVRAAGETYRSRLMGALRGHSAVLERLAVEMYARGLSTRDIEEALEQATGERLLSRTAVSELSDSLWEDYQAFARRDLSEFAIEYLFLDAVFESLRRQGGCKEGLLCAWAICADGRKVLLHLTLGNKESYESWLEFLRDMQNRGLRTPVLITSDGAPGLIRAIREVYGRSLRQRCLAHKVRNVIDKLPESARAEVKAAVQAAYYAPNPEVATLIAADVLHKYQGQYPSAMKSFQDDWEACIAYMRCPAAHHKRIRTTNLLEHSFVEERRRTKVIPRFFNEQSCLKLAFASLWQASQHWHGVRMSEFERQQLVLLRQELGLTPTEPNHARKAA